MTINTMDDIASITFRYNDRYVSFSFESEIQVFHIYKACNSNLPRGLL